MTVAVFRMSRMGLIGCVLLSACPAYADDFLAWGSQVFHSAVVGNVRTEAFRIPAACASTGETNTRPCDEQRVGKVADLSIVVDTNEVWEKATYFWQFEIDTYVTCGVLQDPTLLPAMVERLTIEVRDRHGRELFHGWRIMGEACEEKLKRLVREK